MGFATAGVGRPSERLSTPPPPHFIIHGHRDEGATGRMQPIFILLFATCLELTLIPSWFLSFALRPLL